MRKEVHTSRLSENGPGRLPAGFEDREVCYSMTFISRASFLAAHAEYKLILDSGDLRSTGYVFPPEDVSLLRHN